MPSASTTAEVDAQLAAAFRTEKELCDTIDHLNMACVCGTLDALVRTEHHMLVNEQCKMLASQDSSEGANSWGYHCGVLDATQRRKRQLTQQFEAERQAKPGVTLQKLATVSELSVEDLSLIEGKLDQRTQTSLAWVLKKLKLLRLWLRKQKDLQQARDTVAAADAATPGLDEHRVSFRRRMARVWRQDASVNHVAESNPQGAEYDAHPGWRQFEALAKNLSAQFESFVAHLQGSTPGGEKVGELQRAAGLVSALDSCKYEFFRSGLFAAASEANDAGHGNHGDPRSASAKFRETPEYVEAFFAMLVLLRWLEKLVSAVDKDRKPCLLLNSQFPS